MFKIAISGIVILALLCAVGWFARNWLGKKADQLLREELSRDGIHLTYDRFQYTAIRGLILKDIRVFPDDHFEKPHLIISNAACKFSVIDLLFGKPFSGVVTVSKGEIEFRSGERVSHLSDIDAKLHFLDDAIKIEQLVARTGKLSLVANGIIPLGEEEKTDEDEDDDLFRLPDFTGVIDVLESLAIETRGDTPVLDVVIRPAPANSQLPLLANGVFRGNEFRWREIDFDAVEIAFESEIAAVINEDFPVDLDITITGRGLGYPKLPISLPGRFSLNIAARPVENSDFPLPVSLDIDATVETIHFPGGQTGATTITAQLAPRASQIVPLGGKIDVSAKNVSWQKVSAPGAIKVTANFEPSGQEHFPLIVDFQANGDPVNWETLSSGTFHAEGSIVPSLNPEKSAVHVQNGKFSSKGFRYDQLKFTEMDAVIDYFDPTLIELPQVKINAYQGNISGTGTLNLKKDRLVLRKLSSSADLLALLADIDPDLKSDLARYQLANQPRIEVDEALINLEEFAQSRIPIKLMAPLDLTIDLGEGKSLRCADLNFAANLENGVVQLSNVRTSILGGEVTGQTAIPLGADPLVFPLRFDATGISLPEIGKLAGADSELIGLLELSYRGKGGEAFEFFTGEAAVLVREGKFYTVPLFGPLHLFLRSIAPNLGRDAAKDLSADLVLTNGVIFTENLRVESKTTKILAKGKIDVPGDFVDIDVRANFKGVAGLATALVSKVLEIQGDGPINDIEYGLKNMEIVGDAVKGGVRVVRKGAGVVRDGVGAVRDRASAVREGVGEMFPGDGPVRNGAEAVRNGVQNLRPGLFRREEDEADDEDPISPAPGEVGGVDDEEDTGERRRRFLRRRSES